MKLNLIPLLISFIGLHGVQQKKEQPQENEVDFRKITVVNQAKKSFNMGSRSELEKAFGKTKMVKEEGEAYEGGYAYTYKYKGLEVSYSIKNCEDMEVKGPEYRLLLNGAAYTVGEPITKLRAAFPLSYKNRRDGAIRLGIKNSDTYVCITYNVKGIITSLEVADDNS
jgi:hypothetical protein